MNCRDTVAEILEQYPSTGPTIHASCEPSAAAVRVESSRPAEPQSVGRMIANTATFHKPETETASRKAPRFIVPRRGSFLVAR